MNASPLSRFDRGRLTFDNSLERQQRKHDMESAIKKEKDTKQSVSIGGASAVTRSLVGQFFAIWFRVRLAQRRSKYVG